MHLKPKNDLNFGIMTALYDLCYRHSISLWLSCCIIAIAVPLYVLRSIIGLPLVSAVIFAGYLFGLMAAHKGLRDNPRRAPLLVLLFLVAGVIICIQLALPVATYDTIHLPGATSIEKLAQAFCYTVGRFTTAGYSEAPKDISGKLYDSFISLLGVTHGVAFIGLLASRLDENSEKKQKPSR